MHKPIRLEKKIVGNIEALLEAEGIDKKRLCEGKDCEGNHGDYAQRWAFSF